jgi:hypothetical protein
LTLKEKGVLKTLLIRSITSLVEIVHVQLPDKAAKVIMLEVFWKNLIRELIYLFHDKAIAFWVPRNNLV